MATSARKKKENRSTPRLDDRDFGIHNQVVHDVLSDSEAGYGTNGSRFRNSRNYYQASSLPNIKQAILPGGGLGGYGTDIMTDDDQDARTHSYNDFEDNQTYGNPKMVRTGRQRKKLAARAKGGEFQTKRKKRRVYFCCIASEIDVEKLIDYLHTAEDLLYDWKFELHNEVLHLYKKGGAEEMGLGGVAPTSLPIPVVSTTLPFANKEDEMEHATTPRLHTLETTPLLPSSTRPVNISSLTSPLSQPPMPIKLHSRPRSTSPVPRRSVSPVPNKRGSDGDDSPLSSLPLSLGVGRGGEELFRQDSAQTDVSSRGDIADIIMTEGLSGRSVEVGDGVDVQAPREYSLANFGAKEVFVFDFGAAVFWGFSRGEEAGLLKTIRMFATKGLVGESEFHSGEDDMAYIISDGKDISIANDVFSLPEYTLPKQRLAVSFAIAQSSVLAIFESRIEKKVEEYKYIPEALAAYGKVHLSERQLGMMIGEVFVIRHDVNLHTEILDTPDFFWKEKIFEGDYKMVSSYLEMSGRTEILNKRLDMLRELLDVLQQQMENAHAVKLEWIVIYLIIAEVLLQGLAIVFKA